MSDLFKEFEAVSEKQWKAQVQAELKGADFAETLVSETLEGFQVKPLYTRQDVENSVFVTGQNNWKTVTPFMPGSSLSYDSVDGVWLEAGQQKDYLAAENELLIVSYRNEIPEFAALNQITFLDWDLLSDLAEFGNYAGTQEDSLKALDSFSNSGFKNTLSINISRYQNAGAGSALQLALMLAEAAEYIHLKGKVVLDHVLIRTAAGSNFFFEIAKLRALRILWKNLSDSLETESEITVLCESSMRNKSAMDKENNIIRTTFEAAAGIFGNADLIALHPYDELFIGNKENAAELGYKQQFVLREESFLNHYTDPLKGAYFVEFLTEQLAINAWEIFKKLEKEGGFVEGLKSGNIQQMIAATAQKEQEKFDAGELNFIGVNKYPKKEDDFVSHEMKKPVHNSGQTLFRTITPKRLAEKAEKTYAEN